MGRADVPIDCDYDFPFVIHEDAMNGLKKIQDEQIQT